MACAPMAESLGEEFRRMQRMLKWSGYKHVSFSISKSNNFVLFSLLTIRKKM